MPFFLLARDEDDQLRLLTPDASQSRQDALAVLAKLTSDPAFDAWDAEVLLVDIDSALPVLLVRPSDGAADPDSLESGVAPEDAQNEPPPAGDVTFMWPAPAHVSGVPAPEAVVPPASQVSTEEAEAFASYVSLADEEMIPEPEPKPVAEPEPEPVAEPEPEAEEPAAESATMAASGEWPVPEIASELEPAPAPESSVQEPSTADERSERFGEGTALLGMGVTAVSMGADAFAFSAESEPQVEAEAVVPQSEPEPEGESAPELAWPTEDEPEVGPMDLLHEDEAEGEPEIERAPQDEPELMHEAESEPDALLGEDRETLPEPTDLDSVDPASPGESTSELRDALARTTAAMEAEALSDSEIDSSAPSAPAVEPPLDRWPWESVAAASAVAVPLGATVISDDEDTEEVAPMDLASETPDGAGDAEETDDLVSVSAFLDDLEPIPPVVPYRVGESELEADSAETAEDETTAAKADDRDAEVAPEPAVEADSATEPESVPEPMSMDSYVCDDCVYVGTCPNKDQRLPKDCGSFQWK